MGKQAILKPVGRGIFGVHELLNLAVLPLDSREMCLPDDSSVPGFSEFSRHVFKLPDKPVHDDPDHFDPFLYSD